MDAINFNLRRRNNGFLNNLYRVVFEDYMGFYFDVNLKREKIDCQNYCY